MKYVYVLLALLALAGTLEWHGHHRGYDDGVAATQKTADKKVKSAQDDATLARTERDAATQSLANVQRLLAQQKTELALARTFADAALADRNRLQKQLDHATAHRKTAIEEAAHAQADCSDLVHLPVCPAVAERLWGNTAVHSSAASH